MKVLLVRIAKIVNDRLTRILFYDQTLKKGYASLGSFSKFSIIKRLVITVVALPFAFLIWIILVTVNRFIPVRIYRLSRPLRPATASFYIQQLEPFCRRLQVDTGRSLRVFIDAGSIVNLELTEIYESHFSLYLDDRKKFLRDICALIPRLGIESSTLGFPNFDSNWDLLPAKKIGQARFSIPSRAIEDLGIERFKFVVFSHPSVDYYKEFAPSVLKESNRFINLDLGRDALEFLTHHGMRIVRVGVKTSAVPESFAHLPIIDLSGLARTDQQDLWLFKNCLFHWSMGANGAWWFAQKFGRPSLVTDSYALIYGNKCSFYTFQMAWSDRNEKLLTLSDMVRYKKVLGRYSEMQNHGISFVQNSSQQLLSAVIEVMNTLLPVGLEATHDMALLSLYDEITFKPGRPKRCDSHTRPCNSFLESIQEFLV